MEYTIKVDEWIFDGDGLFHAHIPFECDPDDDVLISFIDDDQYIKEHQIQFDSLNNGDSDGHYCNISSSIKPTCEIKVEVQRVEDVGGRVVYDKHGNPEYLPPSGFDLGNLSGIVDNTGAPISTNTSEPEILDFSQKEDK